MMTVLELEDTVVVLRDMWMKTAQAVGDVNPIHYDDEYARKQGFRAAICPAVHIFGLAEKKVRKGGWKNMGGRAISASFDSAVYDEDRVNFYRNGRDLYISTKFGGLDIIQDKKSIVTRFTEEDFSPESRPVTKKLEDVGKITPENVCLFDEGVEKADGEVYYAFPFGRIIGLFLRGREGTAIKSMKFNLHHPPRTGEIYTFLDIQEEAGKITRYNIDATCIQYDEPIVSGTAYGFRLNRERKRVEAA